MAIAPQLTVEDLEREGVRTIAAGTTLGVFDFTDDEDYFLFAPLPNREYRIEVDSGVDTELGLFGGTDFERLGSDDDDGPGVNPELTFTTDDTPTIVLIEVDTPFSFEPGDSVGEPGPLAPYAIRIVDRGEAFPPPPADLDVVGDTLLTAGGLAVDAPIAESIEDPRDTDLYITYLAADRSYGIRAEGVDFFDPFLQIFTLGGTLLDQADAATNPTPDAALFFAPEVSGFYAVAVSASDLDFGEGPYALSLTDAGALLAPGATDRVGDIVEEATRIEIGATVPGLIDTAADFDVYSVLLEAGSRYTFSVTGPGGLDPTLSLLNDAGNEVRFSDNSGGSDDASITFTMPRGGPAERTYYLEVGGAGASVDDFDLTTEIVAPFGAFTTEARDVALLYEAGLNRAADEPGVNFWIDAFEDGFSLRDISFAFLDSAEFEQAVGDPAVISDVALVTGLYENVLDRPADPDGLNFWLSVLERPAVDAADLLIAFARSAENVNNSATIEDFEQIDDGVWAFV